MTCWKSHALLGLQAARILPENEQKILAGPPAGKELQHLPPCRTELDQLAASCLMMDWLYEPDFQKYCQQKNGLIIPHMIPDSMGVGAAFAGNAPSPGKTAEILEFLLRKTVQVWKSNSRLEFLRQGGILGHFLQDMTAPTHTLAPRLLRELFPDPQKDRLMGLGKFCYQIAEDLQVSPQPLAGTDIPEAAFYLVNQAFTAMERARRLLPELLQAAYDCNQLKCREILRGPAADAVELTARAWHTVFCLARNEFPENEVKNLESLDLTEVYPAYHHPDLYAFAGPDVFCHDGKLFPLQLKTADGPRLYRKGWGMTGHSGMKFFLNKAFSRLEFELGLAADTSPELRHINLDFSVEISPGWNDISSEELQFNSRRIYQCRLQADSPVRKIALDLQKAGTLILASRAAPYQGVDGMVHFDSPDLGIVQPKLFK